MSDQMLKTENEDGAAPKKGQLYSMTGEKSEDETLLQAYSHLVSVPGKDIMTKMQVAFNFWFNISEDEMNKVGDLVKIVHAASLLFDDIRDRSVLRRGNPVAHSIFGASNTISTGNYVTSIALEKVLQLDRPEATMAFIEQLMELQRGQGMDIYWRDNFVCPTEEEYSLMVMRKSFSLLTLAIRLMQMYSTNKDDFSNLVKILGVAFQIIEDYKNLNNQDYSNKESYCEDITEGKFSFPIIHAVHSHPEDKEILEILRLRTSDNKIKRRCLVLLKKYGSLEYTRNKIEDLWEQALEENDKLGNNPYLDVAITHVFRYED